MGSHVEIIVVWLNRKTARPDEHTHVTYDVLRRALSLKIQITGIIHCNVVLTLLELRDGEQAFMEGVRRERVFSGSFHYIYFTKRK